MSFERDDMLPLFIEEGHEHVQALNASLLSVERDPDNDFAIREAFRAAHSLKGMAATMGFEHMTRLTHELEESLGHLQDNRSPTRVNAVSMLLEACDLLDVLLGEIEETGVELTGVSLACDRLVGARGASARAATHDAGEGLHDERYAHALANDAVREGRRVLRAITRVEERSLMPGARAFASLLAMQRLGELVASEPTSEQLEQGEYDGRTLVAWIATDVHPDELRDAAGTSEVIEVEVKLWEVRGGEAGDGRDSGLLPGTVTSRGIDRARSVRIDVTRLDDLMHGVGELLVQRARVEAVAARIADSDLRDAIDSLDRAAHELQTLVMDVRMVSVEVVLRMLPRLVRDLSGELGKQVRLTMSGRDTELDRTVIDVLADPLLHLVRNAIDHGIEPAEERVAAGKPPVGVLDISASAKGGTVAIKVRDDGAGMRPERIRQVAVQRGVLGAEQAEALNDESALELCFAPGFSTRDSASIVSGRGVGLDVVRSSVRSLGGDVLVASSDEGTVMTIRLPLTLAIRPVLLVDVDGEGYAFHSDRVAQAVVLVPESVQSVAGRPATVHHGAVVPLVSLRAALANDRSDESPGPEAHVVFISDENGMLGVIVDRVVGHSEVVTRPLPSAVAASPLLAASTVLGDGSIVFLLDGDQIARQETVERHHDGSPDSVTPMPRLDDHASRAA